MKITKRFLTLLAVMLIAFAFCFSASAAEAGVSEFSVIAEVADNDVTINWWQGSGKNYVFLPADIDSMTLEINFTASADVTIDGMQVESGDEFTFTKDKTYTVKCDGISYSLVVMKSENIPSLHIATESGSMDAVHKSKSHKEKADIVIFSDGEVVAQKELEYIKGRGNATWSLEKKPYNIKFDKKIDLFGMGKAKKWSLLANHLDDSLIRNYIAFGIADYSGLEYTSQCRTVDLYIDGNYYGNYLLCESVEIGETRVDINDLEGDTEDVNTEELDSYPAGGAQEKNYKNLVAGTKKWVEIPVNPENISGGYLLEYELPERFVNEASGFVTDRNQTIVVKSPEYASQAQVEYISALYQEFEDAVYSETGYNSLGRHYTEYIDVESFVKMYVFQEYVKNLDAGLTSFYIYKDADSDVFVAAPVWDFDNSLGRSFTRYGTNLDKADTWWAGVIYNFSANDIHYLPTVLGALYRHNDFFAMACAEWSNTFAPYLTASYFNGVKSYSDTITDSAAMNALRWNIFETGDAASARSSYKAYVSDVVLKFMKSRKTALDTGFSSDSVRIFYDGNGGTGNVAYFDIKTVGESAIIPFNSFTNGDKTFKCWNTKADGTGESYYEGTWIVLEDTKVTLYAQWNEPSQSLSGLQKFIQSIRNFFEMIKNFFMNLFR